MTAQQPDLEKLSISDLESLLAEKRQRESKRLLRTISGRGPTDPPTPSRSLRTTGLTTSALPAGRKGKITRRLSAEEARAAFDRVTTSLQGRRPLGAPAPADRFRRSSLAAVTRTRPPRGPAWLRPASARKGIDLGLQLAEIAFVLLFLWVIGQWLFADVQTDNNVAAEMAAVQVPLKAPAHPAPPPARPAAGGGHTLAPALAGDHPAPAPPGDPQALLAYETRDTVVQTRLTGVLPAEDQGTLAHDPATLVDPAAAGATSASAAPSAIESNPFQATEIRIPKINLDTRVREVEIQLDTWQWEVADFMAGHLQGSADPGQTGNVVIAGHRDIRGKVFLRLNELQKGDDIFVSSGRGIFHYIVRTTKIVRPTQVEIMAPTTDERLTLITCTPVKIASHRLVVIADLDPNYVAPDRGP